ncbi:DOCK6 isoform 16, partial [Pan troglodytes]
RKTLLSTDHAFPYIKTRIRVCHREEELLEQSKFPKGRPLSPQGPKLCLEEPAPGPQLSVLRGESALVPTGLWGDHTVLGAGPSAPVSPSVCTDASSLF